MKIIIASYSRSGQSYLQSTLTLAFSKTFGSSHLNKPGQIESLSSYDHVVTLVRSPVDSISSIISMELEFNKNLNFDQLIIKRVKEYIDFYSFILNKADTFIDFNEMINKTNKVIQYISNITGDPILNKNPKNLVIDTPSQNFLKTSKTSNNYKYVFDFISKINLDECFALYHSALERCINLDEI